MTNERLEALREEVKLMKELIELRKQLAEGNAPTYNRPIKFGDTDYAVPYWKLTSSTDNLVGGYVYKNEQLSLWPSSEEMWEGIQKPSYYESNPYHCDCNKGA